MQNLSVTVKPRMGENAAETLRSIAEIILGLGGLGGLGALIERIIARRKITAEAEQIKAKTSQQVPGEAANMLIHAGGDVIGQYQQLLNDYQASTDRKIAEIKRELKESRETVERYAKRLNYLMSGIQLLHEQIIHKGGEPCWTPDEWKSDPTEDAGITK